jgi:hypothetical protein
MKKASEYYQHAEQCRALAANAKVGQRDMLLQMAETWEFLAKTRVEQLTRKRRIEILPDRKLADATERPRESWPTGKGS